MKLAVRLRNENGKEIKLAGNEYIDIDVMHGNKRIAALTLRDSRHGVMVFVENDEADTSTPLQQ